jgi:ABC-type Fe3+-hydroxamate transport system substrate-binding protein
LEHRPQCTVIRRGEGDPDIIRKQTEQLVALAPDIIIVSGSPL